MPKLLFSEQPRLTFSERVGSLETCRRLQWENWIQILLHPHPPAKIIQTKCRHCPFCETCPKIVRGSVAAENEDVGV